MYLKLFKLIQNSRSFGSLIKMYSFRKHTFTWLFSLFKSSLRILVSNYLTIIRSFYVSFLFRLQKEVYSIIKESKELLNYSCILTLFTNYFYTNSDSIVSSLFYNTSNNSCSVDSFIENRVCEVLHYSSLYIFLTQFSTPSLASLPNSNKSFTVLRSPHTDKKSREQFHLKYNTKVVRDHLNFYIILFSLFSGLLNSTLFIQYKKMSLCF